MGVNGLHDTATATPLGPARRVSVHDPPLSWCMVGEQRVVGGTELRYKVGLYPTTRPTHGNPNATFRKMCGSVRVGDAGRKEGPLPLGCVSNAAGSKTRRRDIFSVKVSSVWWAVLHSSWYMCVAGIPCITNCKSDVVPPYDAGRATTRTTTVVENVLLTKPTGQVIIK